MSGGVVQDEMDGEDGANGEVGRGMRMVVTHSLLTGSDHQFQVTLKGGEGGDGGAGGSGKPGVPGSQGNPGDIGEPGANGQNGTDGYIYGCDHKDGEGDARNCNDVITSNGTVPGTTTRYGHEEHCCHDLGFCDTYRYWQLYTFSHNSKSDCDPSLIDGKPGGDGDRGFDGGMGGNGTDATPGTKGGNGGRGGSGGEAGEWQLEVSPEIPLNAFVTRIGGTGGAGGASGPGGSRASGGAGGDGGAGGAGGQGGHGGAPGQCNAQERKWTAHKNWHETHDCLWYCKCDKGTAQDPCSDFVTGSFGECKIDRVGAAGLPGARGADGVDGAAGYPGRDAETAEAGEEGEPGQDATTYIL